MSDGLTWSAVDSSFITAVSSTTSPSVLYVQFADGGVYAYDGADGGLFADMLTTESPGALFHSRVRGLSSRQLEAPRIHIPRHTRAPVRPSMRRPRA